MSKLIAIGGGGFLIEPENQLLDQLKQGKIIEKYMQARYLGE